MKCQVCKRNEREWLWQPLGPSEKDNDTFTLPGHQYRGFPAIAVCDACRLDIENGKETRYTYKGKAYIANERPPPTRSNPLS